MEVSKLKWAAITVIGVVALGLIDWVTGYELNFFAFYFLPIATGAWFIGFMPSVILALLCSLVWFGADVWSGHGYTSHALAVWNTIIRLVSFLAIGWSVFRMKQALDHEKQTAQSLKQALSEIKVLETFIPICAQCKKIRDQEGTWKHLEVYFAEQSGTKFTHGYCPECAQKAIEEAGLFDKNKES